jgi:hypothetical protein
MKLRQRHAAQPDLGVSHGIYSVWQIQHRRGDLQPAGTFHNTKLVLHGITMHHTQIDTAGLQVVNPRQGFSASEQHRATDCNLLLGGEGDGLGR